MATTLQMLRAHAMIINGGYFIQPTLIKKVQKKHVDGTGVTLLDSQSRDRFHLLDHEISQRMIEAMKYVKSDIQLKIFSWQPFSCDDPRVEVKNVNFKNYWQLWREGDVLVYPQGANGICLPIVEAMSCGLGVITTDIYPFNEYMPKDLLFKPEGFNKRRFGGTLKEVDDPIINPKSIAEKIDQIANKSIIKYSNYGKRWAEENSWEKLLPRYKKVLEEL